MAKILILARTLQPTALDLAQSLHHNHEVTLVTGKHEEFTGSYDFPILTFFEKWSALEALQFLPVLLQMNPEIVHTLCQDDKLSLAETFITLWANRFQSALLSTSLFRLKRRLTWTNPMKQLVEKSQVVTTANVPMMGHLRGLNIRPKRQSRGVLPPILRVKSSHIGRPEMPEWMSRLRTERLILIPFSLEFFDITDPAIEFAKVFSEKYFVVFLGDNSDWKLREKKQFSHYLQSTSLKDRWLLTGDLQEHQVQELLRSAEALFLARLKLSVTEINRWLLLGSTMPVSLIMDTSQASIHSQIWRNRENSWILSLQDTKKDLYELMDVETLKLQPEHLDELRTSVSLQLDSPVNELNRLYQKAINEKALGVLK